MSTAAQAGWVAADSYRYLDGAGPMDLAWEWLRRDPAYRCIEQSHASLNNGTVTIAEPAPRWCIERWGCLATPSPELDWRNAPILWHSANDPSVLKLVALTAGGFGMRFDLRRSGVPATVVRREGCEHVRLGRGRAAVRIDIVSGSLLDGPVALVHDLADADEVTIGVLRRFLHLCRRGNLPEVRPSANQRWQRQVLGLRVADALAQGASIRAVGVMLFGAERVRKEWSEEALKSQCRRLISFARGMAGGGYLCRLHQQT